MGEVEEVFAKVKRGNEVTVKGIIVFYFMRLPWMNFEDIV